MNPIRVLAVDDSATMRRILRILISQDPELELAGVAANGRIALAMLDQVTPDVVILDLEMPEMDGLATLEWLRRSQPQVPVIVFASASDRGAMATREALVRGASDNVWKSAAATGRSGMLLHIREQLLPRIKTLATRHNPCPPIFRQPERNTCNGGPNPRIVAIAASTGGPDALAEVLSALPRELPVPIVVVQHMPATFTCYLAKRLAAVCALPVREAKGGERLLPGAVWIAQAGSHLAVTLRAGMVHANLLPSPPENSCRPSADVLFRSLATTFGSGTLAVVLTGMGQDGLRGAREVVAAGGRVWAQDETTSVVWGMPGFVAQHGLAERVLPLPLIGPEIVRAVADSRKLLPAFSSGFGDKP